MIVIHIYYCRSHFNEWLSYSLHHLSFVHFPYETESFHFVEFIQLKIYTHLYESQITENHEFLCNNRTAALTMFGKHSQFSKNRHIYVEKFQIFVKQMIQHSASAIRWIEHILKYWCGIVFIYSELSRFHFWLTVYHWKSMREKNELIASASSIFCVQWMTLFCQ